MRRLFYEDTPAAKHFNGLAWLFLGVANTDSLLYDEMWQETKFKHPNKFRVDYALSREQKNKEGGKMYVQDKLEEYAEELYDRMEKGAHMYFCGLKGTYIVLYKYSFMLDIDCFWCVGMMPGILEMLQVVAKKKGLVWADVLKGWKGQGQWHVEVY